MKDKNKTIETNSFIEKIIKKRRNINNLNYLSPLYKPRAINTIIPTEKKLVNNNKKKLNIKELSKYTRKYIFVNTKKVMNECYISEDNTNNNEENKKKNHRTKCNTISRYHNNNNDISLNRDKKRKIVVFTERPKKISDYILKDESKSKNKVYQLTFLDENVLFSEKFMKNNLILQKENKNSNSNIDYYSPRMINNRKKIYNFNTYDDRNNLVNDVYSNDKYDTNYISNNNYNTFNLNNIYKNYQNKDQIKIRKIQSVWRGLIVRRIFIKILNKYYNIMKIFSIINTIFYEKSKPIFRKFIYFLKIQKEKNDSTLDNEIIVKNKNERKKNNTNLAYIDNQSKKENAIKNNVIENKNVDIFIPGEKKKNKLKENYVYIKKKNTPIRSPLLIKRNLRANNKDNKKKLKEKTKKSQENNNNKNNYNEFINSIIKYIIKKNNLLFFPLLIYRLKILQKIKLFEFKYKCLFKLIAIKKKLLLYPYFDKYRNNINSKLVNQILAKKNINYYINNDNINNKTNDQNFTDESYNTVKIETNKESINTNENLLKINDNKNNNNEKNISLNSILNKKESNYNKNVLKNIVNKWNNKTINNVLPISNRQYHKYNSNNNSNINNNQSSLDSYNRNEISKKKTIKVKKIKSAKIDELSHNKLIKKREMINSFESENNNSRKMKIYKLKVLHQQNEAQKNFANINNGENDNVFFIRKIMNISRKINNKKNIFRYFNSWKKKVKEKE